MVVESATTHLGGSSQYADAVVVACGAVVGDGSGGPATRGLATEEPQLLLVAPEAEAQQALQAWQLTPRRLMPLWLPVDQLIKQLPDQSGPLVLAISSSFLQHPDQRHWLAALEQRDPRECSLTTPLALAERQLERLPPKLVPEPWLACADPLEWSLRFAAAAQTPWPMCWWLGCCCS